MKIYNNHNNKITTFPHHHHRNAITLSLVIFSLIIQPITCWWGVSHMLTAEVAKKTLSPTTLKCVTKAIQNDYYPDYSDFITASLWSDHIKASPPPFGLDYTGGTRAYNEWHFIDFPYSSSSSYTCDTKKEENVVWALERLTTEHGRHELTSRGPVIISPGVALRMAIHFIGDIHQPLHCISHCDSYSPKGDRGGNSFYIDNGNYSVNVNNLHAFWDSGGGQFDYVEDHFSEKEQALKVPNIAKNILNEFPKSDFDSDGIKIDSDIDNINVFLTWGEESFNLAKNIAYDPKLKRIETCGKHSNCAKIPNTYREMAQTLIRKRIALGGYRLAAYIEQYFSPTILNCKDNNNSNENANDKHGGITVGIFIFMLIIMFILGIGFGMFILNKLYQRKNGNNNNNNMFSYQAQVDDNNRNHDIEFTEMVGNVDSNV